MSAHEIGYRLRQEIYKRADAVGLARAAEPFDEAAAPGRFFFDDPAERAALIAREDVDAAIAEAGNILRHRFDLLGCQDLDFGDEIDWHLDPVAQIRAPRLPWHRINFLDYAVAGDHKVTWELNRHQHLVTLAKAHLFTGDQEHLDEIAAQWRHWMRENPYPLGINWASSLEVAFRSLSWIWVLHLVSLPADVARDMRAALGFNARYIEKYLSLYFAPNTHLLGEAVALFFIGVLYPGFRSARRWRDLGWNTVVAQIATQVQPDGMHFEQSVYYHVYALDFFRHTQVLGLRNGITDQRLDAAIDRMSALLEGISQGGIPPRFGDDDGGRLFNPRRNRTAHMRDPISTTEESIWLNGGRALAGAGLQSRSVAFEHSGLYCMSAAGRQIVVDAGPHGTGNGGHGHADALSLQWIAGGREWLTDPGAFRYVGSERDAFRGTAAHNTLRVDGLDQAEAVAPFIWRGLPNTAAERWKTGPEFDVFCGSHDGYHRLPQPVTHRRWVVSRKTGECLVRDVAMGEGEHSLEICWHLGPEFALHCHSERVAVFAVREGPALAVLNEAAGWSSEVVEGEWSPAYGARVPALVLRFNYRGRLPAECAVVLLPLPCATAAPGTFSGAGPWAAEGF